MQKISLGLEFSDAVSQLLEELGPSKEFWEKRAELETVFESKIKDANIELHEWLQIKAESHFNIIMLLNLMRLPANTGIPNDDSFTAGMRACGSELAKLLMDCIFDSGSTQEPTALNCGRQVKQCGPGSIECPNFCTCVSQYGAECGTISDGCRPQIAVSDCMNSVHLR
jgi:hypothetical protein